MPKYVCAVVSIKIQSGLYCYDNTVYGKKKIVSIFVPLINKYVRQVIHFKSKPTVLVSGSSARLAQVLDNIFITVCQHTLAQWAVCYGSNGTTGWMDQNSHDMNTESESWHDNISTAISEIAIYIYMYIKPLSLNSELQSLRNLDRKILIAFDDTKYRMTFTWFVWAVLCVGLCFILCSIIHTYSRKYD